MIRERERERERALLVWFDVFREKNDRRKKKKKKKMQNDQQIWTVINPKSGFCRYKGFTDKYANKGKGMTFCRNPYNAAGECCRKFCPLANSRYATIREQSGRLVLFMKTIERAHAPRELWERVELDRNYEKALATVDARLEFWPEYLRHKVKQRLTKLTQYLIRCRRLRRRHTAKLVPVNKKVKRREESRERKAERAARLEQSIKKELLDRLKRRTYGDLYDDIVVNLPETDFERALDEDAELGDAQSDYDSEYETEDEREIEYEIEGNGERSAASSSSSRFFAAEVDAGDDFDVGSASDYSDDDDEFEYSSADEFDAFDGVSAQQRYSDGDSDDDEEEEQKPVRRRQQRQTRQESSSSEEEEEEEPPRRRSARVRRTRVPVEYDD
jgi:protein MAK16